MFVVKVKFSNEEFWVRDLGFCELTKNEDLARRFSYGFISQNLYQIYFGTEPDSVEVINLRNA